MSDEYPLYTGLIEYGATGEGQTFIFFAHRAASEEEFRQEFGDRINLHYGKAGTSIPAYNVKNQPPPYDPENPVTYTWEETQKMFPDSASWYMVGADVFKGLPPRDNYIVRALVSNAIWKSLESEVKIDNSGQGLSGYLDIFLVSYFNYS